MRPQLLMGAAGIFMIGTILCCIASGRWLLSGEINIFNALASINASQIDTGGGFWAVVKGTPLFIQGIITALSWNYPFLASPWCIFVKIPLWIISIGVVWGLIELCIMVVQGLVGAVRNIFT